jgi:hypothetical protein
VRDNHGKGQAVHLAGDGVRDNECWLVGAQEDLLHELVHQRRRRAWPRRRHADAGRGSIGQRTSSINIRFQERIGRSTSSPNEIWTFATGTTEFTEICIKHVD